MRYPIKQILFYPNKVMNNNIKFLWVRVKHENNQFYDVKACEINVKDKKEIFELYCTIF